MRLLGIDVGDKRVGLAISDVSQTLARPLVTLTVSGFDAAVAQVADEATRLAREDDGLEALVVGRPTSLDGTPTAETSTVDRFVAALRQRTALAVHVQDERLSSREAESRLAITERDWRERKKKLDAAAAAIILQDYLDRR